MSGIQKQQTHHPPTHHQGRHKATGRSPQPQRSAHAQPHIENERLRTKPGRDRERPDERSRDMQRNRDIQRERERDQRDRVRDQQRDREQQRERDQQGERERDHGKDRERDRERERSAQREPRQPSRDRRDRKSPPLVPPSASQPEIITSTPLSSPPSPRTEMANQINEEIIAQQNAELPPEEVPQKVILSD